MTENKASFFARLEPRVSPSQLVDIKAAYIFSKFGHRAQKRKEKDADGNPLRYFEHVRRVAIIMIDEFNVYDPELISCALLHDCLEDTEDITIELLERMFGIRVARIVRRLTNQPFEGYYDRLATSGKDTILVKLCDRTDNVRSLGEDVVSQGFRLRKANETIDKYLPIFNSQFKLIENEEERHAWIDILNELNKTCFAIRNGKTL